VWGERSERRVDMLPLGTKPEVRQLMAGRFDNERIEIMR